MYKPLNVLVCLLLGSSWISNAGADDPKAGSRYFTIMVVDQSTGRGVPMVQLKTTNEVAYYTDSAGVAAIHEPGWMDQEVYFYISSHGYEYPADGFGYRGKRIKVHAGGSERIEIKRINIAERLYRMTGEGIYRDSALLGRSLPTEQPLLNGLVTGQDSVLVAPYAGKLYWIWGDTNRPSYPLGNFGASGATSEWPAPRGTGLDPSVGVNLKYFVDDNGFSRAMVPSESVPGPGPKWLGGLITLPDEHGKERLLAQYSRMKSLGETYERGLVIFNDETMSFDRLVQFDLADPLYLIGHPVRVRRGAEEYFYFGYAAPYATRVRATMDAVRNPAAYESLTCLKAGTRYEKADTELDRDTSGALRYDWKPRTMPLGYDEQNQLASAGKMKPEEGWLQLRDIDTDSRIKTAAGSVYWNEYRKAWVMIVQQAFGTSAFGEIWYAEADTITGPWLYARKVVTHDKYTFYNPKQHPYFSQQGGRLIYFEGTYSELFSGSPVKTPRYDYNQIMYRLDLADPRLALPAPVYRLKTAGESEGYMMREQVERGSRWNDVEQVAFFAVPPDRRGAGLIPVYARETGGGQRFSLISTAQAGKTNEPLFYALPPQKTPAEERKSARENGKDVEAGGRPSPAIVPLYEYELDEGAGRLYSTRADLSPPGGKRSEQPICRVWRNPASVLALDPEAKPVP